MGELATLAGEIISKYLDTSCLEPVSSHILAAGKIKNPRQICINDRNIASTGDMKTPAVQDLIWSCEELDLSNNNLHLTSVPEILEHFPLLKVLNLCRNPLNGTEMMDKGFVASRLEVLVLNNCLLSWEGLFWLLQICPELKRLHLDSTTIDFAKPDQGISFPNIEVLHFSKNRLSPLVLKYLSHFFPNVKELYFMQNQSEEAWQVIDESIFTELEKLSLIDCSVCEWGEIESFGCLKSLKHLKLLNCPVLEGLDVNLRRQLVIARLPYLITLNGGETITRDARDKAERAFIRYYMEEENKPARYIELEALHGKLDKLIDLDLKPKKYVSVVIEYDNKSSVRRFSQDITVMGLKKKLEPLLNLSANSMRLYFLSKQAAYGPDELKVPSKKLYSLLIEDGDTFIVDRK
ncbi:tubulin-specific chaperone cofactor E-like protein isoform X3 [Artemia franciscana]|uniref:Ubiquitin-like domain-containing protein n=2 Tax=Artemia franciscana TaxID=6661 RepID=A0AA88H5P4_ARTSF|nr:hypothetical protein QYM36_015720 [Artemia franciscana]